MVEQPDGLIRLEVEGNGFLCRMVVTWSARLCSRHWRGWEVHRRGPEGYAGRKRQGRRSDGAPPHGLFLHEVVYPAELLEWEPDEGHNVI